jgi:hypothetical protein
LQEAIFAVESLLRFPVPKIEEVGLGVPERARKAGKPVFLDKNVTLASLKPLLKVCLCSCLYFFCLGFIVFCCNKECGDVLDFKYESALGEPKSVKHKGHIDARQSVDLSSLINPANPKKLFKNLKQIGSGGFADVCLAWDGDNQRVVVKRIRLTNLNLKYVLDEVINHKSSCHANIVSFIDCYFVLEDQELWVSLGQWVDVFCFACSFVLRTFLSSRISPQRQSYFSSLAQSERARDESRRPLRRSRPPAHPLQKLHSQRHCELPWLSFLEKKTNLFFFRSAISWLLFSFYSSVSQKGFAFSVSLFFL